MPKGTALSPTLKLHASSMSSPVKPLSVRVLPQRTHERPQKTDACCRRRSKCDGRTLTTLLGRMEAVEA